MKEETKIYTRCCILNQIAAGGSDDWQIRLGKYIVSLQYVDSNPANIGSGEGGQHYDRQCDGFETVRARRTVMWL